MVSHAHNFNVTPIISAPTSLFQRPLNLSLPVVPQLTFMDQFFYYVSFEPLLLLEV